ncbi:unnamed protein product [Boreogadus saida]
MNRDMEKKGIVPQELSWRTAAKLPALELPDCRRSFSGSPAASAAVRQRKGLYSRSGRGEVAVEPLRGPRPSLRTLNTLYMQRLDPCHQGGDTFKRTSNQIDT